MSTETEEAVAGDEASSGKSKFPLALVLSIVGGVLLIFSLVGGFIYLQTGKAAKTELLVLKNELKKKNTQIDGLKEQFDGLAQQVLVLKEKLETLELAAVPPAESAAVTVPAGDKEKSVDKEAPAGKASSPAAPATATPALAAEKKAKADAQSCELVGKSAEEQAATLKRCVSLIDTPAAKPKPR